MASHTVREASFGCVRTGEQDHGGPLRLERSPYHLDGRAVARGAAYQHLVPS